MKAKRSVLRVLVKLNLQSIGPAREPAVENKCLKPRCFIELDSLKNRMIVESLRDHSVFPFQLILQWDIQSLRLGEQIESCVVLIFIMLPLCGNALDNSVILVQRSRACLVDDCELPRDQIFPIDLPRTLRGLPINASALDPYSLVFIVRLSQDCPVFISSEWRTQLVDNLEMVVNEVILASAMSFFDPELPENLEEQLLVAVEKTDISVAVFDSVAAFSELVLRDL